MKVEYPVTREPVREPTHPGELLAEVLETERVSILAAAEELGITRQTLHRILAKRAGVTPDMAIRLGQFVGNGPGLWLRMQQAYDLWHANLKATGARVKIRLISTLNQRARTRTPSKPRPAAKRARRRAKVSA